jgi:septum formation protein
MLLQNAGLSFVVSAPAVDERALEAPLAHSGATPSDVAEILAEAKAVDVSQRHPGLLTIGGDQTLSLEDEQFHKPQNMDEARRHLLSLSGKVHQLNSAVVFARDGQTIWRHVEIAHMHMRELSPEFIGRHLADVGDIALSSVGAYQLEGKGIQLFDKIDGDYFTIVGLPLIPMLKKLRQLGEIDG